MSTYAFSDLHGNYKLWEAIKHYIKEDDIVYCLGDIVDRGNDGIKILQEIKNDIRFKVICGNHEHLLLDYVTTSHLDSYDRYIMRHNGTIVTYQEFNKLSNQEQQEIIEYLQNLPFCITININDKQLFLSHAGLPHDIMLSDWYEEEEKHEFYTVKHIKKDIKKECLWNRDHILEPYWDCMRLKNVYMIHGHTPVQTVEPGRNSILTYCEEHKIDIDLGTPTSNMIALLNLETFETIYFTTVDNI